MDINDIRALLTVLGFVGFVGIFLWAYGRGAQAEFEIAQEIPFADDALPTDKEDRR